MLFPAFYRHLEDLKPEPRVLVSEIQRIIDVHHTGVGTIRNKWFPDFPKAGDGNFIWLEEERTSAYEEPFSDAIVFVNDRYRDDREMTRVIAAKESMHVFDTTEQRTCDGDSFRRLLSEIASKPMQADISEPYAADREALWKAILCLVPHWLRDAYLEDWQSGAVQAHELAVRWWIPEKFAAQAMNPYYDEARRKFGL